ncbi:MAG: hypothetical protein V3574_01435 [Candidatus Moraniibacteriota bacterium]
MNDIANSRSRIFIKDIENKSWQLFSLEQNKKDGSIYLGSPEFTNFEWLSFKVDNGVLSSFKVQQDNDGHLSFHGSGQVHVKSGDEKYKLSIKGQHLLKREENDISLRHLFTLFPKKPEYIPISEALNRKSDQVVNSSESLKPFVAVAFALPRMGLKLNFMMSFNIDELENIPGGVLGTHLFPLVHHDIFMVFYRTKFMDEWPKRTMLQYLDGVTVPMFIGKPEKMLNVQYRIPKFDLKGNELSIELPSVAE